MAQTQFLYASFMFFLSFIVVVLAGGDGYHPTPNYENPGPDKYSKPSLEKPSIEKPDYEKYPKPSIEKPDTDKYPKPSIPKPDYEKYPKPSVEKPDTDKYPKPTYGDKPNNDKYPKPSYGDKPDTNKYPKPSIEKPNIEVEYLFSTITSIQGLVYCKSGHNLIPLQGAVARITCQIVDKYGYEATPYSFLSEPADAKGYYMATFCPSQLKDNLKITQCKVFLEMCPLETCNVPTDINNGIHGALLSSYRFLSHKKMNLYTVEPMYFTTPSEPKKPAPSNGY